MPVATEAQKGLMSATDKKCSVKLVEFPKNSARKILQLDGIYQQFVTVGFLLSGSAPLNFILSGRSENTNTNIFFKYIKINDGGSLEIYKKDNCFYIKNPNRNDACYGFLISTQNIGTENVAIDDSFTLLE